MITREQILAVGTAAVALTTMAFSPVTEVDAEDHEPLGVCAYVRYVDPDTKYCVLVAPPVLPTRD